jgi:hypothetical protein
MGSPVRLTLESFRLVPRWPARPHYSKDPFHEANCTAPGLPGTAPSWNPAYDEGGKSPAPRDAQLSDLLHIQPIRTQQRAVRVSCAHDCHRVSRSSRIILPSRRW